MKLCSQLIISRFQKHLTQYGENFLKRLIFPIIIGGMISWVKMSVSAAREFENYAQG